MLVLRNNTQFKYIALFLFFLISFSANSLPVHPKEVEADLLIDQLYHRINALPTVSIPKKLHAISMQFLGKPYLLTALGEGIHSRFDQFPQYRTDAFDCETYVTTLLALALADNRASFKQLLRNIRYKNGRVSFTARNHFTELDWNLNNQRQGYVKDITASFKDKRHHTVAKMADALIDKPSWYQHFPITIIRLHSKNPPKQALRWEELKRKGDALEKAYSHLPYLPFTTLFDSAGHANNYLFAQIPDGAIIEIVRPNWDLSEKIGTHLNVSHIGFAFWRRGTLFYDQASSQYGKVVEVNLIDYLKEAQNNPTIQGINVQVIVPKYLMH